MVNGRDRITVTLPEFARDVEGYLRASWGQGLSLVLTVDNAQIAIDTFADLEGVYAVLEDHVHES